MSSDDVGQVKTVVIEELQVFGHKTVIKDLKVTKHLFLVPFNAGVMNRAIFIISYTSLVGSFKIKKYFLLLFFAAVNSS